MKEKINSIESLKLKPLKRHFLSIGKFYSTLERKPVGEEEYKNSKFLYTTLKMRGMSNLNDLCNALDIILLCKIFENGVQIMYVKFICNPQKITSASKLSGCIQNEQ